MATRKGTRLPTLHPSGHYGQMPTLATTLLAQAASGYRAEFIAAGFGLGGVLVGALLSRDSERRRWLREARERSYVEFILRTEELNSAAATLAHFVAVYDREKSGETKEQLTNAQTGYWSIVENLRSEHRRIELIGSHVFRHTAHCVYVEAQVKVLFDLDGDDLLNQYAWQRWLDYDVDDIENERERLSSQARRDLGNEPTVPRLTGPWIARAHRYLTPKGRRDAARLAQMLRAFQESAPSAGPRLRGETSARE